MNLSHTERDRSSGWRCLFWGGGLMALPWILLGGFVLFGVTLPAMDGGTASLFLLGCMLGTIAFSLAGAACLIAALVLLVSADGSER